ncbi:MAG: SDR family NAD(P)-dependent oxidoreductase [Legionellales bacterium]|nr:SDR family NAD(P)-dependent oxidoreductase [Legionellales bacterium]
MQIQGQVVIITGGASGLGEATAKRLAQAQAKVIVLDRQLSQAQAIAQTLQGAAYECDVTREDQVTQVLQTVQREHGIAKVCVNCAGIAPGQRIVGKQGPMPLADFEQVIAVNLIGTFNVLRLVAAQMFEASPMGEDGERGVIINTASVAAFEGQIGQAAYSASKGGVVGLTLPAAREFAKFGIRVNTIAPGLMETPMMAGMSEEVRKKLIEQALFPKRLGHPDEYARLVSHIIENPMINGATLRLDGAVHLPPK